MLNLSNKLGLNNSKNHPSGAAEFTNEYSLNFDGVDDYVSLGNKTAFELTGDTTISAWVYAYTVVNNGGIIQMSLPNENESGNYIYRMVLKTDGANYDINIGHEYGAGNNEFATIDTNLSLNTWYHLAAVRDISENTWTLYVNGVAKTPFTYTNQATGGTLSELAIAKNGLNYFHGLIDEVSLFNSAKSSGDITSIYNSGTPTDLSGESGLVGYWRNGDPNGTAAFPTITDDSSNSNDGTMTNMDSGDIVTVVP